MSKEKKVQSSAFKCPSCGADMRFDPQSGNLKCDFCGREEAIEANRDDIEEYDFEKAATDETLNDWGTQTKTVQCENCGGTTIVPAEQTTVTCAFCGSPKVVSRDELPGIKPESVIPFKIAAKESHDLFITWIKKRKLAPSKLKKEYKADNVKGVYIPYWSYDTNASLRLIRKELLTAVVLFYVIAGNIDNMRKIRWLLYAFLAGGLCAAAYGAAVHLFKLDPEQLERLQSTFRQPNRYAQYLLVLVSLCFAGLAAWRGGARKAALVALLVLALVSLFWTFSRAGWLALAPALLVYARDIGPRLEAEQRIRDYSQQLELKNLELREAQAQVVQSEKLAALGNLAAGVAHEINTPIGSLRANADVVKRALGVIKLGVDGELSEPDADRAQRRLRRALTAVEDACRTSAQATDRVDLVLLDGHVEELGQVVDVHRGGHAGRAVLELLDSGGLAVVLVVDLSDDLFEDVLDRDQACGATVFVDDDGEMVLVPLHLAQQVVNRFALGDVLRRTHLMMRQHSGGAGSNDHCRHLRHHLRQ